MLKSSEFMDRVKDNVILWGPRKWDKKGSGP